MITSEKEKELSATYKISDRDMVDFERFYDLSQALARQAEGQRAEEEDMEYSMLDYYNA